MANIKFALRNFRGEPVGFYLVEEKPVPAVTLKQEVGHLIMVLDRSGSMCGSKIEEAKATIEKVFTLSEFNKSELLVSLISYSSTGDVTVHFERTPVQEIMKPGNKYVEQIRNIRATYLTCASQAMRKALSLVGKETTCIALETDGFFNDPSPVLEERAFETLVTEAKAKGNVMINTIAFGGWADFNLLTKIANAASGKMVRADNIKAVYDALHDTAALLTGAVRPAIEIKSEGADYLTAHSIGRRRVNGSTTDLTVLGLSSKDDLSIFRYRKVNERAWNKDSATEVTNHPALYAFARARLAEGNLNLAKYAMVSTKNKTLLDAHAKALTNEDIGAFAEGLEAALYGATHEFQSEFGLSSSASVMGLCQILSENEKSFTVNLDELNGVYNRRGLKRLNGRWQEGKFQPVEVDVVAADSADAVSVSGIEYNNQTATINFRFTRPGKLVDANSRKEIARAAGTPLRDKLFVHRNYTIVGDGSVNVDYLPLNISDKNLYSNLVSQGILPNTPYDFKKVYRIPLKGLPVVDYNQRLNISPLSIQRLAQLRTFRSVLQATLAGGPKAGADRWDETQLADLTKYYLTPSLSFNPPTTTPYRDHEDAIKTGLIDSRVSYEVAVGTPEILSLEDLYSANEYLARRYTVTVNGVEEKKPKWPMILQGAKVSVKTLTARTRLNSIDNLMFPVFQFILGLEKNKDMEILLKTIGITLAEQKELRDFSHSSYPDIARNLLNKLEAAIEKVYSEEIRPITFYVGASGLLPDNWENVTLLSDEALKAKFPEVKTKADAVYYLYESGAGPVLLTVYKKNEWFSTPLGVQEAMSIQGRN